MNAIRWQPSKQALQEFTHSIPRSNASADGISASC